MKRTRQLIVAAALALGLAGNASQVCAQPDEPAAVELAVDAPAADAGAVAPALDAPPADGVPTTDEAVSELAKDTYAAVRSGNWPEVAALGVVLLVWGIRKAAKEGLFPKWFTTDRGGVAVVLLTSFGGAAAHAFLAGATLASWGLWATAGRVAIDAIGGYVGLRKFVWPKDKASS